MCSRSQKATRRGPCRCRRAYSPRSGSISTPSLRPRSRSPGASRPAIPRPCACSRPERPAACTPGTCSPRRCGTRRFVQGRSLARSRSTGCTPCDTSTLRRCSHKACQSRNWQRTSGTRIPDLPSAFTHTWFRRVIYVRGSPSTLYLEALAMAVRPSINAIKPVEHRQPALRSAAADSFRNICHSVFCRPRSCARNNTANTWNAHGHHTGCDAEHQLANHASSACPNALNGINCFGLMPFEHSMHCKLEVTPRVEVPHFGLHFLHGRSETPNVAIFSDISDGISRKVSNTRQENRYGKVTDMPSGV